MREQAEEAVLHRGAALFLQLLQREEAARGLAHLAARRVQVQDVEPVAAPLVAEERLALRDLVGVMGEHVVDAAAVDVDVFSQIFHGDAGALDVPAGVTDPPRAVPFEGLVLELGFGEPEHEVVLVALVFVLVHPLAHADLEVLFLEVEELMIGLDLRRVEIDVAARLVGEALFHERLDDADEVVDAAGRGLDEVGPLDVQRLAVGKEGVGVELGELEHRLVLALGAEQHLVLAAVRVRGEVADVGDVHHARDVVADIAQRLFQHVLHQIGAQVADVRKIVHRRPAGVHLHFSFLAGDELLHAAGQRVVKFHGYAPGIGFWSPPQGRAQASRSGNTARTMAATVSSMVSPSQQTTASAYFS